VAGKYAILIDGGFIKKKLQARNKHFPTVAEIDAEVARIKGHASLLQKELMRVYFYDAAPVSGIMKHPISGKDVDLSKSAVFSDNIGLHQALELQPDVALREGDLLIRGWALGKKALQSIMKKGPRALTEADFVPQIEQKGVDLRIGLDIARLSLRGLVDTIVVVTGDSDMVPAFRFARREGVRIYLDHMGHGVKRELKVHADIVL
jgi:uncharacterized LabA/DUF88 family protein